jgi:hypothetical protein
MNKKLMAAAVEACFPSYRSAFALHAAWRLVWKGDVQQGRWQAILPTVWGRFA